MRVSTIPRNCHMVGGLSKALGPVDRTRGTSDGHSFPSWRTGCASDPKAFGACASRISLRISQLDGRVTLTVPEGVSEREALAFAASKRNMDSRTPDQAGRRRDCGAGHAGAAGRSNVPDRAGRRTACCHHRWSDRGSRGAGSGGRAIGRTSQADCAGATGAGV